MLNIVAVVTAVVILSNYLNCGIILMACRVVVTNKKIEKTANDH